MAEDFFGPRTFLHSVIGILKKVRRRWYSLALRLRWLASERKNAVSDLTTLPHDILGVADVVVINLEHRADRLKAFSEQMEILGVTNWKKIDAVDGRKNFPALGIFLSGSLGCTLSHIDALNSAATKDMRLLIVCEDDAEFRASREELNAVLREFAANQKLDVLALYGRARGGAHQISANLRIAMGIVGRVCYVVKPHMIDALTLQFEEGSELLRKGMRSGKGDIVWQSLQSRRYFFASPTRSMVVNSAGFSDIEGRDLGTR